ncbi:hypothetical protein CMUS01_15682 [Colletotrichum musicola]|uniref:Uncharacterized protein n=1 Tax=Colletotrichum musicola TaxID=2175873 RepID=A0A8H6IV74_9PEZI|nr:hypothetical protein CMUS01_15682 [Colletotrichum musicola]
MAPFEPPNIRYAKNKAWAKVAKADFYDPDVLWTDYWNRFNTMALPIQDEDAFFADAMAAARTAQNREHLEEILEQKSRNRRVELVDVVSSIAIAAITLRTPFPTPAARSAALKVGQTGSLDSFIQLACGVAFSWNDARRDLRAQPQESCRRGDGEARARTRDSERHKAHEATQDDGRHDAHENTLRDTHKDAQSDALGDPLEDPQDDNHSMGDPWELENTFPPDMFDVYEATVTKEDSEGCQDDDLRRLVETADGEPSESPVRAPSSNANNTASTTHTTRRGHDADAPGAGRPPVRSSPCCPTTTLPAAHPKGNQDAQLPSSPLSNELSFTGSGSASSQPPSPITPRTSSGFVPAQIAHESPTLPQAESPKTTTDFSPHAELADKTPHPATKSKRSLSLDDASHVDDDHPRKRRAAG